MISTAYFEKARRHPNILVAEACFHVDQIDENRPSYSDNQIEGILEQALKHTDLNDDGYIDYLEYRIRPDGEKVETSVKYQDSDLSQIVEGALKQADKNNDGYIDYVEYKSVSSV
ncbi:unnamed protein product [Euphydryas editha]|uniref:EF-hand domain-containing protein n=1 Tax=Euphydryas editha TaxID=104508 RepID=A0AAU9TDQ3_EUPED|nr:unnamed protein product [Euphydryas editha]